jgi:hypothetical protein
MVMVLDGMGFGFGMSQWSVVLCSILKVVRQPLFSRLLANHYSQDCKTIISFVCSTVVRQSFGSSGLLNPFPLLMN